MSKKSGIGKGKIYVQNAFRKHFSESSSALMIMQLCKSVSIGVYAKFTTCLCSGTTPKRSSNINHR